MDGEAMAAQSQFSQQDMDLRAQLSRAVAALSKGADAGPILEALQDEAERLEQPIALSDAYAELVRDRHLEAVPDAARLELYLQAAWSCSQQDGQELATLQAASLALDLSPADERALALAEPLLLEAEEYGELASRYATAAKSSGSPARARHLLERALHMLAPVAEASTALQDLHAELQRLEASLHEREEALLAVAHTGSGTERSAAIVELGERWLAAGNARDGASKLGLDIASLDNDAALDVLERLFDQAEDTARLEQTLLRRVELEQHALGRGRALEKLAAFHHEAQQDQPRACRAFAAAAAAYRYAKEPDEAERAYERLLDLAPDDVDAATELLRLRAAAGDFAGVANAFGVVLRASDDNHAASELLLGIVKDAERAGAAEEFAELSDNVLWRLSDADRELAARLLRASARLYALGTRYDEAAELYRRLIADNATSEDLDGYHALIEAHPGSEWRQNQRRWLFEWQEHHCSDRPTILLAWARFEEQELGDPEAAIEVLGRAAELAPDRPEIWEHLARLRFSEGDGAGGLSAAGELRRLGREVDASLLELLLEHEPTARWALDRMKLTLSAEQRWPELFALYDRALDATTDERARAELLDEAAIAARDVAQDRARALSYWERHAALVPGDARVDLALERLYDQAADRRGLIAHLRHRLSYAVPEQRSALLRKVALLSLDESALSDALDAAEQLSAEDAPEAQALFERVLARALATAGDDSARAPGRRAAQLLRNRHEAAENATERARLLRAELTLIDEGSERRALLLELSRLCERELSDPLAAFVVERELFHATRAEKDRKRLEKLAKKCERFAELCEAYVEAAAGEPEPTQRAALLLRAADVARERLQNRPLAVRLFRRLFELEPASATAAFEALTEERGELDEAFEALCLLLDETERFEELGAVLASAARQRPTPELLSRLGRLQADRLGAPAQAIATHLLANDSPSAAQVFLREPSVFGEDPSVPLELSRRLESAGELQGAERVLRHQLAAYDQHNSAQSKAVRLELVRVLEAAGNGLQAACELTETAKRYPADAEVQRACAVSAALREDWDRAEQCYRALLLLLHSSDTGELRRASVYVALAAIKRRRQQTQAAEELLESAFEAALANVVELSALAQSLLDDQDWEHAERACSELLPLARDLPSAARALDSVARLLEHRASPALAAQASDTASWVAARCRELGDPEQRSSLLAACAELLPAERAEQLLREHGEQLSTIDRCRAELAVADRLVTSCSDETREAALSRLAEALSAQLSLEPENPRLLSRGLKTALAREDIERALELSERLERTGQALDAETITELRKICVKAGKTERAVSLLRAEAEQERLAPKRAALLLEAAQLELESGRKELALTAALEARALDASSADAVLLLAKLAMERGKRDEALELVTSHAESKERKRGKPLARLLRLAADLRLERDELAEALPLLQEAHQLDKTDLDAALLLGLVAIDLDRLETAAAALRVLIAQRELGTREGAAARSLHLARGYFHLARIEQHHGKKTNAKRMALRALEEDPSLLPAQRLLHELGLS